MSRYCWLVLLLTLGTPQQAAAGEPSVFVGAFSQGLLAGWQTKSFKGETEYSLVYDPEKKVTVIETRSNGAASGRYRKLRVDLVKTPFLNWSWKVSDPIRGVDEDSKVGDDFSARLYVVVERGIMGFGSLSVNYVWVSQHPVGSAWSSPFTKNVRLVAVDSGTARLNSWVSHKRNVRADLREQFGEDILSIDVVALMTDTDNSGQQARAFYGDIWFSAE